MCRAFCARAVSPVQILRSVTDTFLARTPDTTHDFDVRDDATGNSLKQDPPATFASTILPARLSAQHRQHTAVTRLAERHVRATALRVAPASLKRVFFVPVFLVTRIAQSIVRHPAVGKPRCAPLKAIRLAIGEFHVTILSAPFSPSKYCIIAHHPLSTFLALVVMHPAVGELHAHLPLCASFAS